MARIVLDRLCKTFKGSKGEEVPAVNSVTLDIADGEFMVLVGPSGCGKSTTLRMIAGLEDISSGTVGIDGKVVNEVEPRDRDVAMVFQNYALYPHMTVYENMAFGLKLRKVPKSVIDERVRDAATTLDLNGLLDRLPKALSGGQRQRVAVGRAIVRQPKAFLFDEPLSNLDAKLRVQMRMEISRLHRQLGATMIYVTHDQVEAMTMGDRIAVMKDGVVQQVADPVEIYHRPANLFVAGFIGTPPMNFFRGVLRNRGSSLCFESGIETGGAATGAASFRLKLPDALASGTKLKADQPIILGVRPEDFKRLPSDSRADASDALQARVELVEPLGSETFVHLSSSPDSFIIRLDRMERATVGESWTIGIDAAKAHFFDPQTERAVT
ncbi:MAG TPA: sn-glycerol-3-phosphate ABC transporter ATP-binding protein UgpC [Candidatus Nitrosotalea sp.]|nr:sn-glycerol-3-phosphate ABC transporter ATP-binding protein UgpC [Candidatus Nitrosotalea sp.]